jgi:hypothetical protein
VSLRLVLDTSAILVYAHGGDDAEGVGELIREVAAEDDAQFGALAVCLAEATLRLSDDLRPMVGVLAAHGRFTTVGELSDWRVLARRAVELKSVTRAATRLAATARSAYVATREPHTYGPSDDAIIPV